MKKKVSDILREEIRKFIIKENLEDEIKAFHGTSEVFDEFSDEFNGTGEGTNAYGWGVYVTEDEDTGKFYTYVNNSKREYLKNDVADRAYEILKKMISKTEMLTLNPWTYDIYKNKNKCLLEPNYEQFDRIINSYVQKEAIKEQVNEFLKHLCEDIISNVINYEMYYIDSTSRYDLNFKKVMSSENQYDNFSNALEKMADFANYFALVGYGRKNDEKTHVLYEVEIPDENGENYLYWSGDITPKLMNLLIEVAKKEGYTNVSEDEKAITCSRPTHGLMEFRKNLSCRDAYFILARVLGSPKRASIFLLENGYVGISMPVGALHGITKEGKNNYVLFNAKSVKIIDKTVF